MEDNYFEWCNGEHRVISSKNCQNTFRNNNNNFFGNEKANTSDIRIINESQVVRNNYIEVTSKNVTIFSPITGEEKYADFVKKMLFDYAKIFPTLPLHPTMKSYATGKIFWQCLNNANWMVFTSQAYDSIYNHFNYGGYIKKMASDKLAFWRNWIIRIN